MNTAALRLLRSPYYGNLVSQHPVNRGLLLWWLPLPQRTGGPTVFDLCGKQNGAMSLGAAWSGSKGHPFPAWLLDADALIQTGATVPEAGPTFTVTGWFRHDTTLATTIYCGLQARWRAQSNGTNMIFNDGVNDLSFTSLPIVLRQWFFFAFSLTGTSCVGYLDNLTQTITATAVATGGSRFYLGDIGFATYGIPGLMTDVRLYNRVLDPSEVRIVRDQGRRGHPETLNRLRRHWYISTASAAATAYPWHHYQQMMAG